MSMKSLKKQQTFGDRGQISGMPGSFLTDIQRAEKYVVHWPLETATRRSCSSQALGRGGLFGFAGYGPPIGENATVALSLTTLPNRGLHAIGLHSLASNVSVFGI